MPKPIKVPIIKEHIHVDAQILNEFSKYAGVTRETIKKSGGTRLLIWLASKGYEFEIIPEEKIDESKWQVSESEWKVIKLERAVIK